MIAFYLRLSLADGDIAADGKNESNSIENQRLLLRNYLLDHKELQTEWKEYVDDGYSGTNFNRPSFIRMIEDAKTGLIDTILVKDFSRLGRDYVGVGDYLEQIFPMLDVRVIAVNSNYDSDEYIGKTIGMEMVMSNLINAIYSRDLSKKIRATYLTNWSHGRPTFNGRAPYGYIKDLEITGGWKIDEATGDVVRMIFEKAAKNCPILEIARSLNELGYDTPGEYMAKRNDFGGNGKLTTSEKVWDYKKVYNILRNFEYTGAYVFNKKEKIRFGSRACKKVEEEKWFVIKDGHAPLVSEEMFYQAQKVVKSIKSPMSKSKVGYPLRGIAKCGTCNLLLGHSKWNAGSCYYCEHKSRARDASSCCPSKYNGKELEETVFSVLKEQINVLEQLLDETKIKNNQIALDIKKEIRSLSNEIQRLKSKKLNLYEQYANDLIDKKNYLFMKESIVQDLKVAEDKLSNYESDSEKRERLEEKLTEYSQRASNLFNNKTLTKEIVDAFIDEVKVYDETRIEIEFKFNDVVKTLLNSSS